MLAMHWCRPLALLTLGALLFGGGIYTERFVIHSHFRSATRDRFEKSSYQFINPLLYCQDQNLSNKDVNEMEDDVRAFVEKQKEQHRLLDASVYFRDLNGGPWMLVNPDFQSIPASLLKVPLAITVYERAESNPSLLTTTVSIPGEAFTDVDRGEYFQPLKRIQPDVSYTVEDIVRFMIEDSDNAALYIFAQMFSVKELQDSYTRLGIMAPGTEAGYTMDVKTYASFFRILYYGTYLTRAHSEHLLSLLADSSFKQGLVAELPGTLTVAHKFGEKRSADGTLQLHDCGIVYKPDQPYLICVMTKGVDYKVLGQVISRISKIVYDHVAP